LHQVGTSHHFHIRCTVKHTSYLYSLILAVLKPVCVKLAATCDETPCGLVELDQYPTSYLRL